MGSPRGFTQVRVESSKVNQGWFDRGFHGLSNEYLNVSIRGRECDVKGVTRWSQLS
jgi:hypothetical protein